MLCLIDGDIIVYNVGFASDKKLYHVEGMSFQYKKEAKEFCDTAGIPYESITSTVTEEPIEFTLHSVKKLIESILEDTGATDCRIFLSGKDNFREEVAVTKPYKGNRDDLHKPLHYQEIRDYLINVWQAEVVEGMEADDMMGIVQTHNMEHVDEYDTIICTLDKDLRMIYGRHYNWRTKMTEFIDESTANYNFYKQLLMGDPTDNIQGVPKIGEKTAEKILAGCTDEKEMLDAVLDAYYTGYYKYGNHTDINDFLSTIDDIFLEHAKLIWIRRENTTELPKELIRIYE